MEIKHAVYYNKPIKSPAEPVSVKDWFLTLFVLSIPIVNLLACLFWAFGPPDVNVNMRNFCRAALIWVVLSSVWSVFLVLLAT
jgi:hypothetical protein